MAIIYLSVTIIRSKNQRLEKKMKIKIGDNNKIEKSMIGQNNLVKNDDVESSKIRNVIIKIIVGVAISVITGIILYKMGISPGLIINIGKIPHPLC